MNHSLFSLKNVLVTSLSRFEIDTRQVLHLEPSWRVTESSNSITSDARAFKDLCMFEKNPCPKCRTERKDFPVICELMSVLSLCGWPMLGNPCTMLLWEARDGFLFIAKREFNKLSRHGELSSM